MTLRTASFGLSGHARQTHLPGTDPALLPDPAGLYVSPRPDALSSLPFAPAGDGAEALFDGRVTATTTGHGTAAERTVLDVSGPWNSVKNAAAASDEAADLAFLGFVHVDAAVGLSSEEGSTLEVVGAKRGNLATGGGADRIDVQVASNAHRWSGEFRIASGAGDDEVRLSPLDVAAAASAGDATFAAAGEGSLPGSAPRLGYDGSDTAAWAELGDGDDLLSVVGAIRLEARGGAGDDSISSGDGASTIEGGEGDDSIAGGRGADLLAGGGGRDTLSGGDGGDTFSGGEGDDSLSGGDSGGDDAVYAGRAADYEVLFSAADHTVTVRDLNPADGDEGTDTLVGMERLRFADQTVPSPALGAGEPGFVFTTWLPGVGYEVWATDGAVAGTAPVVAFGTSRDGSYVYPFGFAALGDGRALFATAGSERPMKLWATDGTAGGTHSVAEIGPGDSSAAYGHLHGPVVLGGDGPAVFALGDDTAGVEVWATDGTAAGTALVTYIEPSTGRGFVRGLSALDDGTALVAVGDSAGGVELWATDGTAGSATLVKAMEPGSNERGWEAPAALGDGRAVFAGYDRAHGWELWITDGTAAGTALLKDTNPGGDGGVWHAPVALGDGRALFTASDPTHGPGLWVTDGTAAGTALVRQARWGPYETAEFSQYTPLGDGRAVFASGGGANGAELWITDGTPAGTSMVEDVRPGYAYDWYSSITGFAVLGDGRALFTVSNPSEGWWQSGNPELWVTDGTAAGTAKIKDIEVGTGYGREGEFAVLGDGRALFLGNKPDQGGRELWVTDGTAEGTALFKDLNPEQSYSNSDPQMFTPVVGGASGVDLFG